MTSAGTLFPFMRETISKAFHCQVFNRYGSREVGNIATECDAHLGLHVNMETHFVEIIDEKGEPCHPGKEGEIVVTLLTNYAMPLIRYRIGDMGIWADRECTCGRGLPLLETVTGRTMDYFVTKEGKIVPSEFFIHLLGVVLNSGWVKKTQIIQEDYDYVKVNFVTYMKPSDEVLKDIEAKIRFVMGESCKVEFEFVDDIPPSSSGKYRYTINKVHKE
jgi:phenylacetate-CoA ligase